ncbi:MAG TPA: hypothetical protein VE642_10330, partial [Pyrinomonadaceae bacterium]|nr:hypothetical protein [Pyrinomonadaceae bacterium]
MALGPRARVLLLAALVFAALASLVWYLSYAYWPQPVTPLPAPSRSAEALTPTPTATPQASIEPAGITEHLRALRDAAGEPRTRAAGSPGDAATARYIEARLRAAGYRVSSQEFRVPLFLERTPPRVSGLRRSQLLT